MKLDILNLDLITGSTYMLSGASNLSSPNSIDIVGALNDDQEVRFDSKNTCNKVNFSPIEVNFETYNSRHLLYIVNEGHDLAGVCIRDTNYPPPRKSAFLPNHKEFSEQFTVKSFICTRQTAGDFHVSVKLEYTINGIEYTAAGIETVKNTFTDTDVVVMKVNEMASANTGQQIIPFELQSLSFEERHMPFIIVNASSGSIDWENYISTKKIMVTIY